MNNDNQYEPRSDDEMNERTCDICKNELEDSTSGWFCEQSCHAVTNYCTKCPNSILVLTHQVIRGDVTETDDVDEYVVTKIGDEPQTKTIKDISDIIRFEFDMTDVNDAVMIIAKHDITHDTCGFEGTYFWKCDSCDYKMYSQSD